MKQCKKIIQLIIIILLTTYILYQASPIIHAYGNAPETGTGTGNGAPPSAAAGQGGSGTGGSTSGDSGTITGTPPPSAAGGQQGDISTDESNPGNSGGTGTGTGAPPSAAAGQGNTTQDKEESSDTGTPEIDNSGAITFEAENMSITQLREEIKTLINGMSAGTIPNTKANQQKLKTYQEVLVKKQKESNGVPNAPNNDPIGDAIINPDDYKPDMGQDNSEIIKIGNAIVGIIKVVGSLIAVGALVVMGIKYMFGSIESKAEYKKSMIPYIIGAVLLFASSQITGIIYDYVQKITQ